jgi:hypothetical protein
MRKLSLIFGIVLLVSMFLPQITMADNGKDKYVNAIGVRQVTDNNVDVTYTGKHWSDNKGNTQYEYVARINQAPIYNDDGSLVDCAWHYIASQPIYDGNSEGKEAKVIGYTDASYQITNNVFSATVIGSSISTSYQGQTMTWNPVVIVGTKEYKAKGNPIVVAVDPINSYYRNNTLEWDYGVCVRRVRVIEGLIQETWIFDKNPKGTVWIKDNSQKTYGYTWAINPYAYDANGNVIVINQYKQVMASEFDRAVYPVTIDPTEVYYTSASDGHMTGTGGVYATIQAQTNANSISDTLQTVAIGQLESGGTYYIYRGAFYFDTSALPDGGIISAVNLSLYGESLYHSRNFSIYIQSGQPTYPHDPLIIGDYDKTLYDPQGLGNTGYNTSGFITTGYNNISLNSTGIAWISKVGTTKIMVRSSFDITSNTPPFASNEQARCYSYEKGAGYRPYLEVTYASSGVPTVQTNPATYITKTTAQLNGYIDADGGETDTASFNYLHWYNQNWSDCIEFTINHSYVDANLTNFPVLVTGTQLNTTDPDFWTSTRANGSDILFTSSDGVTKLNRELVTYCTSTYAMECYVNVTSVSSAADTKFYMYYNNSAWNGTGGNKETNSTATWDTNYLAVYHMNDVNTSAIADSTAQVLIGTKKGANEPLEAIGNFSGDKAQNFDAVNDYITNTGLPTLLTTNQTGSIEVIAKSINNSQNDVLWSYSDTADSDTLIYVVKAKSGAGHILRYSFLNNSVVAGNDYNRIDNNLLMAVDTYYYMAVSSNGTIITTYINNNTGQTTASLGNNIGQWFGDLVSRTYTSKTGLLDTTGADATCNGNISEVRISNTNRSASWLAATYFTSMSPTTFARVTDVFTSTANQSKVTGDSFLASITGLTGNALYGFKAEALNSFGTSWGHWLFINTSVTLGVPANISCSPSDSTINLSWVKGGNSSYTYIRYKIGSYPTSSTDGNAVANQSGVNFTHTGLASGTSYYYRLWGEDGGLLSTTNITIMCTTTASGPYSTIVPLPTLNTSGYDATPNGSALTNNPLYPSGNLEAAAISVPQSTWWMLIGMGGLVVTGLFIYTRSRNLLAALAAMIIFGVIMAQMGIFPIWVMYVFGLSGIGMSWKELR